MAQFQPQYFDFESADSFIDDISGTMVPDRVQQVPVEFGMDNYAFSENMAAPGYDEFSRASVSTGSNGSPMSNHELSSANTSPGSASVKEESAYLSPEFAPSAPKKVSKVTKPKKDKSSHNMIEKKYRTNINSKILALRDAVPSLRIAAGSKDVTVADLEGLTPASKLNKASVLTKATEYIKHLESKNTVLKQQNAQLQRLIQEANLRPPAQAPHQPPVVAPHAPAPHGFGFFPDYNQYSGPVATSQPEYVPPPPPPPPPPSNSYQFNPMANKVLMAGMATMVGQQMFAGGNDSGYQGMAAAPFLSMFKSPSVAAMATVKLVVLAAAVYQLVAPLFAKQEKPKNKGNPFEYSDVALIKQWGLVHVGLRLPTKLSEAATGEILALLNGHRCYPAGVCYQHLLRYFFMLSVAETTFENCLLSLVIGRLLLFKFPVLKSVLNTSLTLKGQMILHLEYRGENPELHRLAELVHAIDGLGVIGSESMLTRLTNLMLGYPINTGITEGSDYVKFVDMYLASKTDYFGVISTWRLMEVVQDLNMSFLQAMASPEEHDELVKDILSDIALLDPLMAKSKLSEYFSQFKAIVNPNEAPAFAEMVHERVGRSLASFKQVVEGPELTDEESWSDEEDGEETEEQQANEETPENQTQAASAPSTVDVSVGHKQLISSLGLVSHEEFTVLVSVLVVYHVKNDETDKALRLLRYLKLNSATELSIPSFSAVTSMLVETVSTVKDVDALDDVVKFAREWLNLDLLDNNLKTGLSRVIVTNGKILNRVEVDTDGE